MGATLASLLAWAGLSACAASSPDAPAPLLTEQRQQTIVYREGDGYTLRLHVFLPPDYAATQSRAAAVFFFGGGWKSGQPSQFFMHCEHLAARGMVAMSAEYRVETRNGTSPAECVEDGQAAVRWVREHSSALGIDPDRIAAGGGSAGGQVAAAAATTVAFDRSRGDSTTSCVPDALILFNAVIDNGPDGYGYDRVGDYWEAFSPLHNLRATTPPTVMFLGTKDRLIPVATAEAYCQRMESLGARCELYLYEGKGHGFFNKSASPESYVDTVAKMDAFLESLGFLDPAPEGIQP